ncbi:MAG: glycosyltransferase [Cyanobacteriota bacterium]|nr:glycosyltransferase [Cyanobacteriota bacterium]
MAQAQLRVNLWGHLSGGFGLGEGARATARALQAAGVAVQWCDLPLTTHPNDQPLPAAAAARQPAAVDLIHTNPNVLQHTDGLAERLQLQAPLRIGYWAWELESFPRGWERGFRGLDQLWCPSSFTATSLGLRSPIPVTALPHLPDWPRAERLHALRAATPRAGRPFTCLFAFDFWSTVGRKNPDGVIEAFQQAFPHRRWNPRQRQARLVLKLASSEQFPQATAALRDRVAADPRITLITEHLPAEQFDALYAQADVLLSLHRAEGFGLSLAEAMAAGLPVVATGYSGNLDFMPPGSGELVPYRLIPIQRSEGDYRAGSLWAEPDLEAAARALHRLAAAPAERAALGERGRRAVRQLLAPERLAAVVQQRLGTLLLQAGRAELLAALPQGHRLRLLEGEASAEQLAQPLA